MIRAFALVSLLLLSLSLTARERVPTVKHAQFEVGNFWIWDISGKETLHSKEKYTVVSKVGDLVLIEMSTAYHATDKFHLHHRFEVNLRSCERAHQDARVKVEFNIKLARNIEGKWERPITMHARAFEEKFNCNGHVHLKNWRYRTEFKDVTGADQVTRPAFKQEHKLDQADQLNGWYGLEEGNLAGVLLEKTFNEGTENEFISKLSSWEMD